MVSKTVCTPQMHEHGHSPVVQQQVEVGHVGVNPPGKNLRGPRK